MTTTPAGRVSRESVREMLESVFDASAPDCTCDYCDAARRMLKSLELIPSAELPAIGVDDAMVYKAKRGYLDWAAKNDAQQFIYHAGLRAALEAALRPTGEDR